VMTKIAARMKCNLQRVKKEVKYLSWIQSESLLMIEVVEKYDLSHLDWYLQIKCPFPFANRDILFTRWEMSSPSRCQFLEYSVSRNDRPASNNFVRAELLCKYYSISLTFEASGLFLESENDEYTNIEVYTHFNARGNMPKYVLNSMWREVFKAIHQLVKNIEQK
jgi:hypothetical protein